MSLACSVGVCILKVRLRGPFPTAVAMSTRAGKEPVPHRQAKEPVPHRQASGRTAQPPVPPMIVVHSVKPRNIVVKREQVAATLQQAAARGAAKAEPAGQVVPPPCVSPETSASAEVASSQAAQSSSSSSSAAAPEQNLALAEPEPDEPEMRMRTCRSCRQVTHPYDMGSHSPDCALCKSYWGGLTRIARRMNWEVQLADLRSDPGSTKALLDAYADYTHRCRMEDGYAPFDIFDFWVNRAPPQALQEITETKTYALRGKKRTLISTMHETRHIGLPPPSPP